VENLRAEGCRRVAVCGFSAGGHLAGCLANLWGHPVLEENGLESARVRPDAAILAYPVISSGPFGHRTSFRNLLGGAVIPPELSLERSVTPENPPTFLWATLTDGTVPAENTLLYAQALRRAGIPFELHLYPHGPHAMALADGQTLGRPDQQDPHVAGWFAQCLEWLRAL
jgi:acetyl esterase/lipase